MYVRENYQQIHISCPVYIIEVRARQQKNVH